MYSPLGLVIFVAVERTFVCFTKGHDHLFQILFIAAAYEQTNECNIACPKAAVNRNALAIDRRPPARRRRTVPCDLRRASLPVPPLYCFLILCVQRSGVVFIRFSGPRFPILVDIRLVTVNRHARCSL